MIKDPTTNPLMTLKADIEAHWREYLPNIVAEFEQEGVLQTKIQEAFDLTETAVLEAITDGSDFWQAWALWREEWAFLPPEKSAVAYTDDVPDTWMVGWQPDAPFTDDDTTGGVA